MSDMPPRKSPTRLQRLRRTIMAGLTIIVPLWVTGWVLKFLVRLGRRLFRAVDSPNG